MKLADYENIRYSKDFFGVTPGEALNLLDEAIEQRDALKEEVERLRARVCRGPCCEVDKKNHQLEMDNADLREEVERLKAESEARLAVSLDWQQKAIRLEEQVAWWRDKRV